MTKFQYDFFAPVCILIAQISDTPLKKIEITILGDPMFCLKEHVGYLKKQGAKKLY